MKIINKKEMRQCPVGTFFIDNPHIKRYEIVAASIGYALSHSGYYQHIKLERHPKEIISYYE